MNSNLQKNDDKKSGSRLLSLDTLRGFDMLFIMGADAFFMCLEACFPALCLPCGADRWSTWYGTALPSTTSSSPCSSSLPAYPFPSP